MYTCIIDNILFGNYFTGIYSQPVSYIAPFIFQCADLKVCIAKSTNPFLHSTKTQAESLFCLQL